MQDASAARGLSGIRLLGVLALFSACGGARAPSPAVAMVTSTQRAAAKRSKEPPLVTPARVIPPTERSESMAETYDSDGSRRFLTQSLRVVERTNGALETATDFLPPARHVTTTELPARLGGGFLFVLNNGGSALLYSAPSFTGRLTALARLDSEVDRLVTGFDRLYLLRRSSTDWSALDPKSGRELDLGSLPLSAGYGSMAFADEWLAAVELPFTGVAATFDAGGTWHPVGLDHANLSVVGGGVLLEAGGQKRVLGTTGVLDASTDPDPGRTARKKGAARGGTERPLGPRPLETAVLHGFPVSNGQALVASAGQLFRVRLSDGSVLETMKSAYTGVTACDPVVFGTGAGFVCGEPGGATRIYAHVPPLSLRLVVEFGEPRRVAQSGRGALVVTGGCETGTAAEPRYCVLSSGSDLYAVAKGSDTERVVGLSDGRAAVIEPPRQRFNGTLTLVGPGSRGSPLALSLPKRTDDALSALLSQGFWLDSLEESPDGKVRGFIAGTGSFAGVRVGLDGKVELGELVPSLDRSYLSGRYGLSIGRGGGARETTDGGFSWSDVALPSEPELKPERSFGRPNGCTQIGCAFAGWLRVGWGSGDKLDIAPKPENTRFTAPGGGRWSLECEPDGRSSRPSLPLRPENDERTVSPWNPFGELQAPARGSGDVAYDLGSDAELYLYRAYVWGPPGDAWPRQARWLVRVRDPYRVDGGIWSTAPSAVPWARSEQAADVFGRSLTGPPSTFRLLADPLRHVALLVVTLRGTQDLFLLEEGRTIAKLSSAGSLGIVSGFAMVGSRVYVGALAENRAFRVYRVEAGGLSLVTELPDITSRADPPALAPALHGDALGLWVHATHHFLYPLDPTSGRVDAPIVVRAGTLSRMPSACSTTEDGYVVGDALSLEPSFDLSDAARVANGAEVRLVVSPNRVCVDGLSAPLATMTARSERASMRDEEQTSPPRRSGAKPPPRAESPRVPEAPAASLVLNHPAGMRQSYRCRD
jgi:hypothetical protein